MPRIHRHGEDAILIFDNPAERIDVPDIGANVICRFADGFGAFWMDGNETVPISGPSALPSVDDALKCVIRSLDAYAERRRRHQEDQERRALQELTEPRPEDSVYWNADKMGVSVPVGVMLRLLNSLPPGTPAREEAITALREFKDPWSGGNGTILHGIVRTPDGELKIDVQRYTMAVHRKKQARYASAVMEKLRKVAADIEFVNEFLDEESKAASVAGIAIHGEALLEMPNRPLDTFQAVNDLLKPALLESSNVHQRITSDLKDAAAAVGDGAPTQPNTGR